MLKSIKTIILNSGEVYQISHFCLQVLDEKKRIGCHEKMHGMVQILLEHGFASVHQVAVSLIVKFRFKL